MEMHFATLWESLRRFSLAGTFAANISRELSFLAQGTLLGADPVTGGGTLDARISLSARAFTHPETGNAGRYWYPTHQFGLSIGH